MTKNKFIVLAEISKKVDGDLILVGGGAVELYTKEWYVTGDLDIIALNRKKLISTLLEMGFEEISLRHYQKEDIMIDIVGKEFGRRYDGIKIKNTDLTLKVIAIEDIIIDRLCACIHWDSPDDCEQAEYLVAGYRDNVDREYLFERAIEEQVIDRLEQMMEENPPTT